MGKVKQYYSDTAGSAKSKQSTRQNAAIYELRSTNKSGEMITIAVECAEGGGTRLAANSLHSIAGRIGTDLEKELDSVSALATKILKSLTALQPGEVEIEFGVELGGEFGVPLITKGEAKANFKVTLKWKKPGGVD